MASELESLIAHLKQYEGITEESRPAALHFITDYARFLNALQDIEQMVGLKIAKEQIAQQIKTFAVNYRRFGRPTHREMLHTLIYGPPGCGKTQLGQHLAELWATSGCLPTDDGTQIFPSKDEGVKKMNLPTLRSNSSTYDNEKVTLRQSLALKDSHIKQYQEKVNQQSKVIKLVLNRLNNTRKKIKAKDQQKEARVQAQFQEIKHHLKTCVYDQSSMSPFRGQPFQILPVSVPKIPGVKSEFGDSKLPQLPFIQKDAISLLTNMPAIKEFSPKPKSPVKFTRITRGDLIGKYQGHTAAQVRELLSKHVGGVVMIDEAYDLCASKQDDFGKEALTEIINFMTTWPDKIIFIFAGYRDKMEDSVLKFQPGLARRFNWTFEITEYSSDELSKIFKLQMDRVFDEKDRFDIDPETMKKIEEFFKDSHDKFPFYGGDTERLCTCLRDVVNSQHWEKALDDTVSDEEYNQSFKAFHFEYFEKAYQKYLDNSAKLKENDRKKEEEEKSMDKVRHMYV